MSAQDAGAGRDETTITFLLGLTDFTLTSASTTITVSLESTDFTLINTSSSAGATASVEIAILANATNIFDTDEKEIVVTMTVIDNQALPKISVFLLTIVSSPRPRDAAEIFFVRPDGASANAVVLPSVRILASVWHSPDDDEIYEIDSSSDLFMTLSNRAIVLARATVESDIGVYGLTLRILDGARAVTALQTVQVFVGIEPPLVYVDRTRGDGSDANPFLIYDIHQLQAVGGTIAPDGGGFHRRFTRHRRSRQSSISRKIFSATAVRLLCINWRETSTRAKHAIGRERMAAAASLRSASPLSTISAANCAARAKSSTACIFAPTPEPAFSTIALNATVSRLGLDNIEIDAAGVVGGLAAVWDQGLASVVWARGRVDGASRVGGLAGEFTNSTLVGGWFAGEIDAATNNGNVRRLDRLSLRFFCARQLGDWASVGGESID